LLARLVEMFLPVAAPASEVISMRKLAAGGDWKRPFEAWLDPSP